MVPNLGDVYIKLTDSKWYVSFTSKHRLNDLTNIPLSLARRRCTIVENKNVKEKCIRELKKIVRTERKHPKSLVEGSIFKGKEITTKNYQK